MESVPEVAAGPPAGNRDAGYWADLIFGRTLPALFFSLFLIYQYTIVTIVLARLLHGGQPGAEYVAFANRVLKLAFFTMLIVMYVIRRPARETDRRPLIMLVSLIGTFCILATSYLPGIPRGGGAVLASDLLITFGMAWAVWGLAYLRRSFSIVPEARELVTGGPYGLSRNPLYFGEGIASIGVMLPVFGPWQAALLLLFIASQVLRIRWEQRILEKVFGDAYRRYRERVPVLIPFWPVGP